MAWDKVKKSIMSIDMSAIEEKRKRKLTFKQRKFIKYYLESGNAVRSVMRAYNVRNIINANSMSTQILKNIDFNELLEMAGVSDAELGKKMSDGLNATKIIKGGAVIPDLELRHKYLVTALESKNKIKKKLEVTGENGQPIRFNILAGHGFIPPVSRSEQDNATPEADTSGRSPEVQSDRVAQTGPQDNNSHN